MITVPQALDALFALVTPLPVEEVPLIAAAGRVLARDVQAMRDQPPFAASAMDGYAVAQAQSGDRFTVIGESAAGHGFTGEVGAGEAVRIFTGAPIPKGCARVVIQEDVIRDGDVITISDALDPAHYIRPAGADFAKGQVISAPTRLSPRDIALMAAMNIATVPVTRRPKVALISTGDELVMPGETPGPDQIIASNTFGLHAQLEQLGAQVRVLPIARDHKASLQTVLSLVDDADLVITIGGASVGDHDVVALLAEELGLERSFYKVAMRPGKPLMSGRFGKAMMIGLPGNPVSAMVCGTVFVVPVIKAMQGLPAQATPLYEGILAADLPVNGGREHYMRAQLTPQGLRVFERQDSSLLSVLADADVLLVRPPHDPVRRAGENVNYIPL